MEEKKSLLQEIEDAAKRRDAIERERDIWINSHSEKEIFNQQIEWGKTDLWYLCYYIIGWKFYDQPFAKYFCELVQKDPDRLWLVARGHLKSLTITCASTIQYLINNPNDSVAIVSYNSQTAKSFLRQIKNILETNDGLKKFYSDVFYQKPQSESEVWSELNGLNVKRTTTRKESSVFAFGLVDSQMTGMHANLLVFDDTVIQDSVGSPYMIDKTTKAWELSSNLGMMTGKTHRRYCGTRYHYADTYQVMIERGIPYTVIAATDDGTLSGKPILMSLETLQEKLQEQGEYTFSAQMLLKPVADGQAKFNAEDIQYYDELPNLVNKYCLADPANTGGKQSDSTAMLVWGYDEKGDFYLVDGIYDKINLGRRWNCVLDLWKETNYLMIGYESYGMQADLEYFDMEVKRTRCPFPSFKKLGGVSDKNDRILRLVPLFEQRRIFLPKKLVKTSYNDGKEYDIISAFVQQLKDFPYGRHDDLIDCSSRIFDVIPVLPKRKIEKEESGIIPTFWEEQNMSQNKAKQRVNFLRKTGDKVTGWFK